MASIGIYTEYVESYNIFFKWTASSRMKHIYHSLLKINDDHKYLKCPDIWEKNWCSMNICFIRKGLPCIQKHVESKVHG